ncbi:MAG: response regulator transcription factor [Bacteroidetes bacterium]|nr:response regulator transcription factor [Bacteroidota bacterium]MBS1930298.1 response regulator transcription factor [Bacteroidota bacterium]
MNENKIRVMLVDDHRLILESWKILLENDTRFSIVSECENGDEAIREAARVLPDIILMDINMSPMNGFEATEKILNTHSDLRIIGISINNQPTYASHIMKLGAKGFVCKDSSFEELTTAIVKVHQGHEYVCKEVRKNMN